MAFTWAVSNFNMVLVDIPLPIRLWDPLMFAAVMWMVISAALFVHRFYELERPRTERAILGGGIALTRARYLTPAGVFYRLANGLVIPTEFALGCYVIITLIRAAARAGGLGTRLLAVTGVIVLVCGGHDALVSLNVIRTETLYYLPYAQALVLGAFAFLLGQRYLGSVSAAEQLNRTLEDRIRRKEQELDDMFEQRQQLETERLLAEERERLTREIHDGLGGHLVSILALSEQEGESEEIHKAARLALADLRIMIASLDLGEAGLAELLGTFRDRIDSQLRHQGLEIEWQVAPVRDVDGFDPRTALNILRILQEAVTNVLRHANATRILFALAEVELGEHGTALALSVSDDGRGGTDDGDPGYGLRHMRARAEEIGARLDVRSSAEGTTVTLPLPATADAARADTPS
jgi:signal transduction histidine kinase